MSRSVNGWSWDENAKQWYADKGRARVYVRLPKTDPPDLHADMYRVVVTDPSRGVQAGDGNVQVSTF